MSTSPTPVLRDAVLRDEAQLLDLWGLLFDDDADGAWRANASEWFRRTVHEASSACFPVIEIDGQQVVATAIGTLEVGVPNPLCPRGRTVRLANVITLPAYRGLGHGTSLVHHVVSWARSIDADRVDLSATAAGQRIYAQAGFVLTSGPRMKLHLT